MIIKIPVTIEVRIPTSNLEGLHKALVAIRDASLGRRDYLDAFIEPIEEKLRFLEDRKVMIKEAQEAEEERVRLIRSGTGKS